MTATVIAAWAAVVWFALAVAFVVTAHLAWRAGRLAGHAEMLDAATEYHAQRRLAEADTYPAILAVLDAQLDAQRETQQAARDPQQKETITRWQPTPPPTRTASTPPRWRSVGA